MFRSRSLSLPLLAAVSLLFFASKLCSALYSASTPVVQLTPSNFKSKQPNLENSVGVGGYGYPALVALNVKKGVYAPLKSAYELEHIRDFVKEAGRGGKGNLPLEGTPKIVKTEPWDGKDGEIMEEDEFSLEELMGEDSGSKDEL
ncbi:unnamed protein product [Linum tenue]|uniref:Uncharacterized protein n=1 Tax=Linum tenue TaxID=586396 RepID=A0AAV0R3M9_9ROSI|nr:unnamed protein product [Linum tenue]